MTEIIDAVQPAAGWWAPKKRSVADSLRSVGDSMFGYGARDEIKNQNMSREQTIAGAKVKATDALRRGDTLEFLAQSILADPSGSSAVTFARQAGLIPNLPPIGTAPPPSTPQPANVAPQPGAVRPYRSLANPVDDPEANRPARPPSVWDAAPGNFGPTPDVLGTGFPKKRPILFNSVGDYAAPLQPGGPN
jgi:hypothetical protein